MKESIDTESYVIYITFKNNQPYLHLRVCRERLESAYKKAKTTDKYIETEFELTQDDIENLIIGLNQILNKIKEEE